MFEPTKSDLKDLLRSVHEGRMQLPDFQRDYVWNDDDVRQLIASVAKGYPIGALLTLEIGGPVNFKPRLLAGVPSGGGVADELLLDGQQRMTSLYQAVYSTKPVTTKIRRRKKPVERFYYLDMKAAVDERADILSAIVGVNADRQVFASFGQQLTLDLSSAELEFKQDMFPLNQAFDNRDWFFGWREYWNRTDRDIYDLEKAFDRNVLERIVDYKMPIIRLDRSNSREAICLVFEKVNVGGQKLDAFELLTAVYAADEFDLRHEWNGAEKKHPGLKKRLVGNDHPRAVLREIENIDYLQACTLLHTREVRVQKAQAGFKDYDLPRISCNRDALLGLPLAGYKRHTKAIEQGFVTAAAFLNDQKIIAGRDLPYSAQLIVLAAIYGVLGNKACTVPAKDKLTRWFWNGALGELYGGGSETLMARDLPEVVAWITGDGPQPRSLDEAIFQQARLKTLRSRNSAAYKAIHALLMKQGCLDFVSGNGVELMSFFQMKVDIHHIFPKAWCKIQGIPPRIYNSIVNKTALSKTSNIAIGGHAPATYLERIQNKHNITSDTLDDILLSHLIEPQYLRNNDFEGFFNARLNTLSDLIGSTMGKTVVTDANEDEFEDDNDNDNDEQLALTHADD